MRERRMDQVLAGLRMGGRPMTAAEISRTLLRELGVELAPNRVSSVLTNGLVEDGRAHGLVAKGLAAVRRGPKGREYFLAPASQGELYAYYGGDDAMRKAMRSDERRRELVRSARRQGLTVEECKEEAHLKALELAGWLCVLCGTEITERYHACLCHDVAVGRGAVVCGWDNLGMGHYACNILAGTRSFEEVWALPDGDRRVPAHRDVAAARDAVGRIRSYLQGG